MRPHRAYVLFLMILIVVIIASSLRFADADRIFKDTHSTMVTFNQLFNHQGMMYFFIGIVMIFFACRMPFLRKWKEVIT